MQQYAQYIEFIKNHWLLVLAFFVVLGLIIFEEKRKGFGGNKNILPQKALDLINHEDALMMDLRDHQIFMSGHILGAINVVGKDTTDILKKIETHKNRIIILLGKDDRSVYGLSAKLGEAGFKDVYILRGGIVAWRNASLPIIKK